MSVARVGSWVWLLLAACGSSQRLPPPQPYEPASSPEAQTACRAERERAQTARERLLEFEGDESRTTAASAVFAHAECERSHFDEKTFAAATSQEMADRIRAARVTYQDAVNLYEEISNYGSARWSIGARSRLGALHTAFAAKLRQAPAPGEIQDPQERSEFGAEIEELAATIDLRAKMAHVAALETAERNPTLASGDEAVSAWTRSSCESLKKLDPAAHGNQAVCAR